MRVLILLVFMIGCGRPSNTAFDPYKGWKALDFAVDETIAPIGLAEIQTRARCPHGWSYCSFAESLKGGDL